MRTCMYKYSLFVFLVSLYTCYYITFGHCYRYVPKSMYTGFGAFIHPVTISGGGGGGGRRRYLLFKRITYRVLSLTQCLSILWLCVICGANGKYNYPASRLSLGLPVGCSVDCSVIPGRATAMFFGVPSSVTGCK